MKKKYTAVLCMAGLLLLAALSALIQGQKETKTVPISRSGFLLNTFVNVTVYDSADTAILDDSLALCKDLENVFSRTLETSELYKLNHRTSQTVTVSDSMAALLRKGLEYCALSGGAFDITVEPVSSLWNFADEKKRIPDGNLVASQVKKVDYENLRLEGNTLTFLSPDTSIDLGAIAKGYIADRMKEQLLAAGVKSATINLGGNVLCIGDLPDGTPFQIGLQKPFAGRSETFETIQVSDMSVVASGVYERHFVVDGKNYHHLLDPSTGFPYDNGLISVTILSKDSADGDGLSTAVFSLGLEKGMELVNSLENVYACFIDEDYNIYYSDGFEEFLLP